MYTPTSPSSPPSPSGSNRYRQPTRHPTASGTSPASSPHRPNTTSSPYATAYNPATPDRSSSRPNTGHGRGNGRRSEERTVVGTGTIGCGTTWEAQQEAAKEHHLESWEGKKSTQKQQELVRQQGIKAEEEKKQREERETKRRMFAENRFTTVEYARPKATLAGANGTENGAAPAPIIRNRSAAERRERNILPASATSPLRYHHFNQVVAKTQAFQKERQSWEEARKEDQLAHEAYIQTMKGNSPVQTGLADGTRIGKSSELLGDGSVDATTTTTGGINSAVASSPGRLPKLQTNNSMVATNASNVNISDLACGDRPRRETRSSSPPLEVSQQCRREILEMRVANKAEVEQQKEQDLLKHKELRHAVVTSHFNTFKSVKDLSVAKNSVVNQLRNDSQIRSKEREDLVKHIQKDKHDTFAKQKREQIELHEKNRYVTAHENRRRVLKENDEERKRVEIRNQEKEKELEDLRASADARRMIWSGSTPEHRRSAESQRERAAKGGNSFDSSGRRAVARGASRQTTDDGPVELFA